METQIMILKKVGSARPSMSATVTCVIALTFDQGLKLAGSRSNLFGGTNGRLASPIGGTGAFGGRGCAPWL